MPIFFDPGSPEKAKRAFESIKDRLRRDDVPHSSGTGGGRGPSSIKGRFTEAKGLTKPTSASVALLMLEGSAVVVDKEERRTISAGEGVIWAGEGMAVHFDERNTQTLDLASDDYEFAPSDFAQS